MPAFLNSVHVSESPGSYSALINTVILTTWISIGVGAYVFRRRFALQLPKRPKESPEKSGEIPKKEILFRGRLYDVTKFARIHPGGDVLEFYVNNGEDATQAIQQFHHRSAAKVIKMLQLMPSREISGDKGQLTPEREIYLSRLTGEFDQLYGKLVSEGYFEPDEVDTVLRIVEIIVWGIVGWTLATGVVHFGCGSGSLYLGAVLMGICQLRATYVMHEGGHLSLTRKTTWDRRIHSVLWGLICGYSASFFNFNHRKHHSMPQRMDHDYDLHGIQGFVVNPALVDKPERGVNFLTRNQAHLAIPLAATVTSLAWKSCYHPLFAWKRGLRLELTCMALHYLLFVLPMGLQLYLISVVISISLTIVNLSVSHMHLALSEAGTHWVEYAYQHTTNVHPSWWCDWWMGHLNYQIEHHLFPTVPPGKLRAIRPFVKEFAHRNGLPYVCNSYPRAVWNIYLNMRTVSQVLEKLAEM